MKLVSVYRTKSAADFLYRLLKERPPETCISHRKMPSFRQHKAFIRSYPYRVWYLVEHDERLIGAIYLTNSDEIGVSILPDEQPQKNARRAIAILMQRHPRSRYLANVAPKNTATASIFKRMGFVQIQKTYELKT